MKGRTNAVYVKSSPVVPDQSREIIEGTVTAVDNNLVESVREYAFYNVTSLESVKFDSALSVGQKAFEGCTSLESAILPLVTTVASNAFLNCSSLETVQIPSASSVSYGALRGTALVNIELPSVSSIPGEMFAYCTVLENVTLNSNSVCPVQFNSFVGAGTNNTNPQHVIYVHVPGNLIASYQTATNWMALYNNGTVEFVALA